MILKAWATIATVLAFLGLLQSCEKPHSFAAAKVGLYASDGTPHGNPQPSCEAGGFSLGKKSPAGAGREG